MAQSLRDFIKKYNLQLRYDPNTKQVAIGGNNKSLTFVSGRDYGDLGIRFQGSTNYVVDPDALLKRLAAGPYATQQSGNTGSGTGSGGNRQYSSSGGRRHNIGGYVASPPSTFDAAEYLRKLYEQQRAAQRQALEGQLASQVEAMERQRIGIQPLYDQERRTVDAAAIQAGRRLAEILAARGQSGGGENITANVALQAQRGQAIADTNRRETTELSQIEQRIADLKAASARDIAAMEAALEADKARALLEDKYRQDDIGRSEYWNRLKWNYGLERDRVADDRYLDETWYNRWRDSIADQRYQEEQEWRRSEDNPAVKAQILDNMLRELQLQNYGEQQALAMQEAALQLERLKQQLAGGRIDNQTAEVQLEMLREQLNQLRQGITSGGSSGSSDTGSQVDWKLIDRYTKQIDEMYPPVNVGPGKDLYDNDIAEMQQQRIEGIKAYLRNLRASGVPDEIIVELLRLYNIPLQTVGEELGEDTGRVPSQ